MKKSDQSPRDLYFAGGFLTFASWILGALWFNMGYTLPPIHNALRVVLIICWFFYGKKIQEYHAESRENAFSRQPAPFILTVGAIKGFRGLYRRTELLGWILMEVSFTLLVSHFLYVGLPKVGGYILFGIQVVFTVLSLWTDYWNSLPYDKRVGK